MEFKLEAQNNNSSDNDGADIFWNLTLKRSPESGSGKPVK